MVKIMDLDENDREQLFSLCSQKINSNAANKISFSVSETDPLTEKVLEILRLHEWGLGGFQICFDRSSYQKVGKPVGVLNKIVLVSKIKNRLHFGLFSLHCQGHSLIFQMSRFGVFEFHLVLSQFIAETLSPEDICQEGPELKIKSNIQTKKPSKS